MQDAAARIARKSRELDVLALYAQSVEDPVELARLRPLLSTLESDLACARAELQEQAPTAVPARGEPLGTRPESSDDRAIRNRGGSAGLPPLRRPSSEADTSTTRPGIPLGLQVHVDLHMPSIPTSMVQLFAISSTPLLAVIIQNGTNSPQSLRVTSYVEGYSAQAITTTSLPALGTARVEQFPAFFCDRRERLNELSVAALHVVVDDINDDKTRYHCSFPIRLMARQTAVLYQLDPTTRKYRDLRHFLGAWVTPNSRTILEFLRTATDFSSLKAMHGYQVDAEGVREHVRAIFGALEAAEITYVNSVGAFGNVEGQFIQRVRLPSESLCTRSANCIDGTVLMASLLEATGIAAAIVLVPGHAYLGWLAKRAEAGAESGIFEQPELHVDRWEFLETTMIGKAPFEKACQAASKNALDSHAKGQLKILPIARLRDQGVTPME